MRDLVAKIRADGSAQQCAKFECNVITEYVDVAKAFFPDGKEPKFVNAVLDHMAREAKPEAF